MDDNTLARDTEETLKGTTGIRILAAMDDAELAGVMRRFLATGVEYPSERMRAKRAPSFDRYPISKQSVLIAHGINLTASFQGFDVRAIAGYNLTADWLYSTETLDWIPPNSIFAINLTAARQSLEFAWRGAPFNPTPVAPTAGQFAHFAAFDEWIPPFVTTVA